ncbi:hypothetical protein [Streptomyces sp. NPDC008125]|uniref:hypothetical protein n=1 Tax=Streptomyces sp. NPDC008125 TaxID=3364811 RepID=UPI0036EB42E3
MTAGGTRATGGAAAELRGALRATADPVRAGREGARAPAQRAAPVEVPVQYAGALTASGPGAVSG